MRSELNLAEEAQFTISRQGEPQGTLKVGAAPTLCIYRLPRLLHTFRTRYPGVHLIFRPSPVGELRSLIRTGDLDVALIFEETNHEAGPGEEPLAAEPVWVLAAPDHPLVGREEIVPADFAATDVLLTSAFGVSLPHTRDARGHKDRGVEGSMAKTTGFEV